MQHLVPILKQIYLLVNKQTRILGYAALFTYRENEVDEENEVFNHTLAAIHFGSLIRSEMRFIVDMDYISDKSRYNLYLDITLCFVIERKRTFQSKMHPLAFITNLNKVDTCLYCTRHSFHSSTVSVTMRNEHLTRKHFQIGGVIHKYGVIQQQFDVSRPLNHRSNQLEFVQLPGPTPARFSCCVVLLSCLGTDQGRERTGEVKIWCSRTR